MHPKILIGLLFIIINFSNCSTTHRIKHFFKVKSKEVAKLDIENDDKIVAYYHSSKGGKALRKSMVRRIINGALIYRLLDSVRYDALFTKEFGKENYHSTFVQPEFEKLSVEMRQKFNKEIGLVSFRGFTTWYSQGGSMCRWIIPNSKQIIELKRKLKQKKLFKGSINDQWTPALFKAIYLYELFYMQDSISYLTLSLEQQAVERYTMLHIGIIDLDFQARHIVARTFYPPEFARQLETALRKLGYEVPLNEEVERPEFEAIKDFQSKRDLPIGSIDFFTLKALGFSPIYNCYL